ncbi:MAG TPA: M14 family zinc carboxypeptidase [Rugosimonospora sp.]
MRLPRTRKVGCLLFTVAAALALSTPAALADPSTRASAPTQQLSIYRVPAPTEAAAQRLIASGFDVLEQRSGTDLFVLGDSGTAAQLRADGFTPESAQSLAPANWATPRSQLAPDTMTPAAAVDETYDGGYHTLNAQYAHLDLIAANHPDLATVVDYGNSYLKTRNSAAGYDLKAICLTHKQAGDCALTPNSPKPRFLLMTQIHAREIVTGDISWRFIDHLANDYATDSSVSTLLNSTEIWVIPVVNPDGVAEVQLGGNRPYLQRKNEHGSGCSNPPTGSNQLGVDLNRNTSTHWHTTGIDTSACGQQYPGASANSEPETTAIEALFRELFADQRGTGDSTPAPATTRGAMITMHSDAGMNLFPWGWTNAHTGNDAKLRAIAAKMSTYNHYPTGQPGEILYNASGTSDDWAYGELGIASFTIEVDSCGSFTPAYSCTAGQYSKNLGALMYVAGIANAQYA